MSWPSVADDDAEENEYDDNFEYYHQYDSKMCSAAQYYKQKCGWGCKKQVKKGNTVTQSSSYKKSWNGVEKFFLFFWSVCCESKHYLI